MSNTDIGKRLLWHGMLLVLLGLLTGLAVPALTNPRMGLSAHLEGVMNGVLLAVLGLGWPRLVLTDAQRGALVWLALYGTYGNWGFTLLGAVLGTNKYTPIAGAGYGAAAWREQLVEVGLVSLSLSIIAAIALSVWGLRHRRDDYRS